MQLKKTEHELSDILWEAISCTGSAKNAKGSNRRLVKLETNAIDSDILFCPLSLLEGAGMKSFLDKQLSWYGDGVYAGVGALLSPRRWPRAPGFEQQF